MEVHDEEECLVCILQKANWGWNNRKQEQSSDKNTKVT